MGDIFRCIGHGFSMAIADSMPGVSGGTIAFILGFYERFLGAIKDIFSKNREARREAFVYLFKFAIGWAVGMSSCVLIISQSFEKNVYFMSSLFTGFIRTFSRFYICCCYRTDNIKRAKAKYEPRHI